MHRELRHYFLIDMRLSHSDVTLKGNVINMEKRKSSLIQDMVKPACC